MLHEKTLITDLLSQVHPLSAELDWLLNCYSFIASLHTLFLFLSTVYQQDCAMLVERMLSLVV